MHPPFQWPLTGSKWSPIAWRGLAQAMAYALVVVCTLPALVAAQGNTLMSDKKIALVLGNKDYTAGYRLKNPERDVALIERSLRAVGFEVIGGSRSGLNLNAEQMKKLLGTFEDRSKGATAALVYFAGHGLVGTNSDQYLIATDYHFDDSRTVSKKSLAVSEIMESFNAIGAQNHILLIDACRTLMRGAGRFDARGFKPLSDAPNLNIFYATSANDSASDGEQGNTSPFTTALAAHMTRPDMVYETFIKQVTLQVKRDTLNQQEPKIYGLFLNDFYFVPPVLAPPTAPHITPTTTPSLASAVTSSSTPKPNTPSAGKLQAAAPFDASGFQLAPSTAIPDVTKLGESRDGLYLLPNGNVYDRANGLEWMRCSLGQVWTGSVCLGAARKYEYRDAIKENNAINANASADFSENNDWRIPTIRELVTLRKCVDSMTEFGTVDLGDGKEQVAKSCRNDTKYPQIKGRGFGFFPSMPSNEFFNHVYYLGWSTLGGRHSLNFDNGELFLASDDGGLYVRLVRTAHAPIIALTSAFNQPTNPLAQSTPTPSRSTAMTHNSNPVTTRIAEQETTVVRKVIPNQIEDGFELLPGGTARDKKTGLEWMRCMLGQIWNGAACSGTAKKYILEQLQKDIPAGWRVPTQGELFSLVYCSKGIGRYNEQYLENGRSVRIASGCLGSGFDRPTIRQSVFPASSDSDLLTVSPWYLGAETFGSVSFFLGKLEAGYKRRAYEVRLVR